MVRFHPELWLWAALSTGLPAPQQLAQHRVGDVSRVDGVAVLQSHLREGAAVRRDDKSSAAVGRSQRVDVLMHVPRPLIAGGPIGTIIHRTA